MEAFFRPTEPNIIKCAMAGSEICECGFEYVKSLPGDRAQHRRWHDEFVNGVRARPLADDEVAAVSGELRIVLVRPDSSRRQRDRIEKIGRRANREMHYDFGVYCALEDEFNHEVDLHAFAGCAGDRGVALLLLERRPAVWTAEWREGELAAPEREPATAACWTIGFVWVLPRFRRQGFATTLLGAASRFAGVPVEELAWFPPLSGQGALLARRFCPERLRLGAWGA